MQFWYLSVVYLNAAEIKISILDDYSVELK